MASLPSSAYCGDTITWTQTLTSGTTGDVVLRHVDSGHIVTIEPSISGETWTVTVAPIDTAEAPSGVYSVKLLTLLAGVRETVDVGTVTLKEPIDRPARISHVRKMVTLLERHLEGRLDDESGRGLESYTVGGVPITKLSFMDARMLLEKYRRDAEQERIKIRSELGLGTGRRIQTHFE